MENQPSTQPFIQRIEAFVGKRAVDVRTAQRGYSPAKRLILDLDDGTSLFAKIGTNEMTADWLRNERRIYESLKGAFMPRCLGWDDDGVNPILLLEDLSHAHWPPPWTATQVQLVHETLQEMWQSTLTDLTLGGLNLGVELPKLADYSRILGGWQQVAADPKPFLSLGLASERWLAESLPTLLEIDEAAVVAGDSLLHLDLRSDNMCLVEERVVLIDWNKVCIGNPDFDLGAWLPSLAAEGGPPPETLLPDGGGVAAVISGYFAAQAGQPPIPDAPNVRTIQLVQLKTALPWATLALDLPRLDGDG